jgi:hypothetical protein
VVGRGRAERRSAVMSMVSHGGERRRGRSDGRFARDGVWHLFWKSLVHPGCIPVGIHAMRLGGLKS